MAQLTPELAIQRAGVVRRLDLPSGNHVFIRAPTAADILALSGLEQQAQALQLLARVLCYEDGSLYYPNGTGVEELGKWPAEMITELTTFDFLDLDAAVAKKN